MSAAARLYARLAPLEGEDADGTLEALSAALMAPVEVTEVSRDRAEEIVTTTTEEFEDVGPLTSPWAPWLGTVPEGDDGAAVPDVSLYGDAIHSDIVGTDCMTEALLRDTYDADTTIGVGLRLTTQDSTADGYSFELSGANNARIWGGASFTALATAPIPTGDITGIRIAARGSVITGSCLVDGEWTETVRVVNDAYQDAGHPGFWILHHGVTLVPIESVSWGTLTAIDTVAWEALWDPDACPEELLEWLAVANGIVLPPSALTAAEKRYRIKQAAGRYRGTPRALAEEVQLTLTGTKTVYMDFQAGDRWTYMVGTIASETPDEDAVDAAIARQNPAFTRWERVLTSAWSSFVLGPTLVATRVGDEYTIGEPTYPTCQDVLDAFATCQDLLDNDPI